MPVTNTFSINLPEWLNLFNSAPLPSKLSRPAGTLAFTTTGLSPVRLRYPSLGTPILQARPHSLFLFPSIFL